ncbi:MAG: hypothetical protein KJO05_05095 [Bacteroidia bacterium]|nr:hypothetical protein [Bacteroidia bacterium]NNF30812.1 hypothetical protein [Flavobacteriaceae bacterium]MBT8277143.1 hypothetical protein [Bacteroidia bacterium]NNJ82010.1 hypothetical protein [Flavobacteriaceae bacterium]NNK55620.1 hypothetical protein [Flavobacteriaceae bacterium]
MDISNFLTAFWGWYLIIFFVILSFNPKRIKQIFNDLKDQKFTILAAFLAIIIGLLNVIAHNIWESDHRVVVTMLGWISLFLGLSLFIIPNIVSGWLDYINMKLVQVFYVALLFVGIYLLNVVYQLVPY